MNKSECFYRLSALLVLALLVAGCRSSRVCVCDGLSPDWCEACSHLSRDCPSFR